MEKIKKKKHTVVIFGLAIVAFFLLSSFANAACPAGKICLENPIPRADSVPALVNLILKGLFGIVGTVALVIFMYGGFTWMTAQGAEKKIKQGWDTLTWGALGLVLIFGSYIVLNFLLGILLPPTVQPGGGGGSAPAASAPASGGGANLDSLNLNGTDLSNPVGGFQGEPLRLTPN